MSLHDDLEDMKELAKTVISDKKAEKEKAEQERKTVQLVCPYCGSSSRFVWEEGKLPSCPNCGAAFEANDPELEKLRSELESRTSTERSKREAAAAESEKNKRRIRRYVVIGIVVIVVLIAAVIVAKLNGGSLHMNGDASFHFQIS